ncbi:MAG: hypothetical protein WCF18_08995 [Chthoniobacteraceae bacterium]
MKTVLHVLSMAFSGSTLLDALLDSQPRVSSLGEVAQLWEEKPPGIRRGPCHVCGLPAEQCAFWKDRADENPYDYAFTKTGADFLADTSKSPQRLTPVPSRYRVKPIAIFKTPHEWACSVRAHERMRGGSISTVAECFFHWENLAGEILHHIRESGAFLIHYRALAGCPEKVLAGLCVFAGIQFDPSPIRALSFWTRKSHALGGNSAVIDQECDRQTEMDLPRETWLAGKYLPAERWRKIHYDDSWKADSELRAECARCYLEATPRLRSFSNRLGLGSAEQLAAQVAILT